MYGYICPECGAHLDPEERCECREEKNQQEKKLKEQEKLFKLEKNGQLSLAV